MKNRGLYFVLLLCLLLTGCTKQDAKAPEANTTVTLCNQTVRFALPEALNAEPSAELDGQILQYRFTPMVYSFPDALPMPSSSNWCYSGLIDIFSNAVDFFNEFESGKIVKAPFLWNHSTPVSEYGPVEGTDAPSYLFRETHDLFTAAETESLWDAGVLQENELPHGADFWHIVFARPGEQTMVVFSLSCEAFTQTDAVNFAKSVVIQ